MTGHRQDGSGGTSAAGREPAAVEEAKRDRLDDDRLMELLWRPEAVSGSRGPQPKVSRMQIVDAGVAVADAGGLADLSMRKVAATLQLGVMSLYNQVAGRSELIELMVDRVFGELAARDPAESPRDQIRFCAQQIWQLYVRHPWVLDEHRPQLPGPGVIGAYEDLYAALAAIGFAGQRLVSIATMVLWYLNGLGHYKIAERDLAHHPDAAQHAGKRMRMLFACLDPAVYPTLAGIYASGGFTEFTREELEPSLERILDAIELLAATDHHRPHQP